MSEQSDRLITAVAKNERMQLARRVVTAACCWRVAPPELKDLFTKDLSDAVDVLRTFEERYKDRLDE